MFKFKFPANDNIRIAVRISEDLAKYLGFGSNERITNQIQPTAIEFKNTITQSQIKAESLVYDTGMVIVTFDYMSSNTTSGTLDEYMGSLHPESPGVLKLNYLNTPAVQLPHYTSRLCFTIVKLDQMKIKNLIGQLELLLREH